MRARTGRRGYVAFNCVLAGASVLALGGCAKPAPPDGRAATAPRAQTPGAAIAAGESRIFIDAATGQPREPTTEDLAQLTQSGPAPVARAKADASREVVYPNGTVGVIVGEETLQPLQACMRADGSINDHCGHQPSGTIGTAGPDPARGGGPER